MELPIIQPEVLQGIDGSAKTDATFIRRTMYDVAREQPVLGHLLMQLHVDVDNGAITKDFANGYINGLMYTYLAFKSQAECDEMEGL